MKNLIIRALFISLSFTTFSCNENADPEPVTPTQTAKMGDVSFTDEKTPISMIDPGHLPNRAPSTFNWGLVNTTKLGLDKSMKLTSPFTVAAYPAGDIGWKSDGGCYSALFPTTVTFSNLGIANIKDITIENLKILTFKSYQINAAPDGSYSWTNYLPVGTIVACKTAAGKYYLLEVKDIAVPGWIELNVYHGLYSI
ncbi:hypothetical protein [Dyadobacter frigoris]|uniref:Uncharacterized protein n=1 Tax=Dyadobacter frigoris TaxID=2576211 RepID=A0A4U6D7U6_9BACT|nr:hypothetical protein [Dyadobacter frigoris]TKT92307.1 hypothetical protein FDK13_10030 [Dyadobacter frigoris]